MFDWWHAWDWRVLKGGLRLARGGKWLSVVLSIRCLLSLLLALRDLYCLILELLYLNGIVRSLVSHIE
jgi:hypothetical protein